MVMNEPIDRAAQPANANCDVKSFANQLWLYVAAQSNDEAWRNASSTKFYTILMTCNAAYADNL